MKCKNCGNQYEGNYCNECGQSSTVGPINFRFLLMEIPHSVFQLNRGLLYTIKELALRPGHTIREFMEGKRKRHYKPLAFFLITSAIYVLITHLMDNNTYVADLVAGFTRGMTDAGETSGERIIQWIFDNQTWVALTFVPVSAFATWLAFRKWKYNFFEHLVLKLYISGQQMFIYLIYSFFIPDENILATLPVISVVAYNIWTYLQFFSDRKWYHKVMRLALSYLIFALALSVVFIILVRVNMLLGRN